MPAHLPADLLQVHRSLVDGLGQNPEDTAVFTAVADLAEVFGLQRVAIGLETEKRLSPLPRTGGSLGQGYYFAKPLPAEAASKLLKERRVG